MSNIGWAYSTRIYLNRNRNGVLSGCNVYLLWFIFTYRDVSNRDRAECAQLARDWKPSTVRRFNALVPKIKCCNSKGGIDRLLTIYDSTNKPKRRQMTFRPMSCYIYMFVYIYIYIKERPRCTKASRTLWRMMNPSAALPLRFPALRHRSATLLSKWRRKAIAENGKIIIAQYKHCYFKRYFLQRWWLLAVINIARTHPLASEDSEPRKENIQQDRRPTSLELQTSSKFSKNYFLNFLSAEAAHIESSNKAWILRR